MPVLTNVLQTNNAHIRDKNIQFYEPTHTYTIIPDAKSKYKSVTTWNHSHFPHFDADDIIKKMMRSKGWKEGHKYWGLTAAQIKAQWTANGAAVSGAGTNMHFDIECFMNNPDIKSSDYKHSDLLENYLLHISSFTPFRIEDAQSNGSNPVISAPERGILNEKWCKKKLVIYNYNYKLLSHVKRISLIFYAILGLETDILAFTAAISIINGSLGSGLYLVIS